MEFHVRSDRSYTTTPIAEVEEIQRPAEAASRPRRPALYGSLRPERPERLLKRPRRLATPNGTEHEDRTPAAAPNRAGRRPVLRRRRNEQGPCARLPAPGRRPRTDRHQPLADRDRDPPDKRPARAPHLRAARTRRPAARGARRQSRPADRQPRVHAPQQGPRRAARLRPAAGIRLDRAAMGRGALRQEHPDRERPGVHHLGTARPARPAAQAPGRRDLQGLPPRSALAGLPRRRARAHRRRLRRSDDEAAPVHPRGPPAETSVAGAHPRPPGHGGSERPGEDGAEPGRSSTGPSRAGASSRGASRWRRRPCGGSRAASGSSAARRPSPSW